MILAQGDVVGRKNEKGSDSLGRWTWIKLVGCNQKIITLISAYQVCVRPTKKTGTTAYHQQESLLRQKGARKAKPRKFFHRDLNEFVRLCKTRNESIILVGDFNEPMTERSSTARIASNHGLVDILFQKNSHLPEPKTYVRGSTRIDYALLTPDLTEAVKRCGYEPFQKRIKSDHRGLFIDFDTTKLFGNETQKLGSPAARDFTAKNPANNSKYIECKFAHLLEQNFFHHLARLQTLTDGDHDLAERLDSNLLAASESAGNKLKRFPRPWWSMAITKARAEVDVLQQQLSGYNTKTEVRALLLERIRERSLDLHLPDTPETCKALLQVKTKALRMMEKNSQELRHAEMQARANLASDTGNNDKKTALNQLRTSEAHAAMYRKIKAIRGKYNKSGFTSIEVPTSCPPAFSDPSTLPNLPDPTQAIERMTVNLPEELVYYL